MIDLNENSCFIEWYVKLCLQLHALNVMDISAFSADWCLWVFLWSILLLQLPRGWQMSTTILCRLYIHHLISEGMKIQYLHSIKHSLTLFLRSLLLKRFITHKKHYQLIVVIDVYRIIRNNATIAQTSRLFSECSPTGSQSLFPAHISSLTPSLLFSALCWLCPGKTGNFVT